MSKTNCTPLPLSASWDYTPADRQGLGGFMTKITDKLVLWQARARERQELVQMDDRALQDVGLTRSDMVMEAQKPFWRA